MSRLAIQGLTYLEQGPIDLSVGAGECVSLEGESGAGKTLMLRAVADLDEHGGVVSLDGADARSMSGPTWRGRVGMLAAESAWWSERVRGHFFGTEVDLEPLGLGPEALDYDVGRLSSGERQRLAIARLLARRPRVLLLDEPTASLDGVNVARVERLLLTYREATEAAVVWVTHDREQAARVATRHFALSRGRLDETSL